MTLLVAWKEGMALSQQHLQQSDKFFLSHIKNAAGLPSGMNFGFSKLLLEEELIKEGQFAFKECKAIFPSGLSFIDSENHAVKIEARNFAQIFDKNLNHLDVYLTLDLNYRYKVVWENCPDMHSAEDFAQTPIFIPMPTIVFGGESLDGKEYIQVAKLLRNSQNSFEVDKNFYPPLVFANGYEYFSQKLKYFDRLLQSRIDGISHSKELLLRDLKSLRAVLCCLQNANGVLPFAIFCEMSRFLQKPFDYIHAEFDKSFSKIFAALNDFLLSEKKTALLQKRMQKEGQTFFAQIKELGTSTATAAWLAVETKLSPEEAIKLIPSQLKIAPQSKLSSIVVSAMHGINCVCSITPKTIQEMPGVFYFKLASDSKLWKDLCEENEMGIYSPITLQINSIDVLMEIA